MARAYHETQIVHMFANKLPNEDHLHWNLTWKVHVLINLLLHHFWFAQLSFNLHMWTCYTTTFFCFTQLGLNSLTPYHYCHLWLVYSMGHRHLYWWEGRKSSAQTPISFICHNESLAATASESFQELVCIGIWSCVITTLCPSIRRKGQVWTFYNLSFVLKFWGNISEIVSVNQIRKYPFLLTCKARCVCVLMHCVRSNPA